MRFLLTILLISLLASCTDRSHAPITPDALDIGAPFTVFAATSRAKTPEGSFGYDRSEKLQLLEMTVSIPPAHKAGDLEIGYANPDPIKEFTLAGQTEYKSPNAFLTRIKQSMRANGTSNEEIVLFVHGYNATQTETVFRAAQLATDMDIPGTMMVYSWPSQGKLLGYAYDIESMMFARDGLEKTIRQLRGAGFGRILLVGHSMGSALVMETLRQIEIEDPGWSKKSLSGVALISPDLDVELFRNQMARITHVPEPFLILVSGKDPVLGISSLLRGDLQRERLGSIKQIDDLADLPVTVIDTTAFSKGAGSPHFVAATSPALIAFFKKAQHLSEALGEERIIRDRLLPGTTVVQSNRATEVILTPSAESPD